jgi:predicted transcriptional regulator
LDICSNKHGGNPESLEAYLSTPAAERQAMRDRIMRFAMRRGSAGITIDEISQKAGLAPNCISGRISELKRDGLLVTTSERRNTRLGRAARVLVAKDFAK